MRVHFPVMDVTFSYMGVGGLSIKYLFGGLKLVRTLFKCLVSFALLAPVTFGEL